MKMNCCRKHFGYNPNCVNCRSLNEKISLPEKELTEQEKIDFLKRMRSESRSRSRPVNRDGVWRI